MIKVAEKRRWRAIDILVIGTLVLIGYRLLVHLQEVLTYQWAWGNILSYLLQISDGNLQFGVFVDGFFVTLRIIIYSSLLSLLLGSLIGICACFGYVSRYFSMIYIAIIRNMPPIVFMFIYFYFLTQSLLDAINLGDIDNSDGILTLLLGSPAQMETTINGIICLSFFEAAFVAEIVRGGINAIEKDQWTAGDALALRRWQTFLLIIAPQAFVNIIPILIGQFIWLIKDSAILSVIGIRDLTFTGAEIASSTKQVFESWLIVMILYILLCYPFVKLFNVINERQKRSKK